MIVRGVNGGSLRVMGKLTLMLKIDGWTKPLEVRAIEGIDHQLILGIDFCRAGKLEIKFAERLWCVDGREFRKFTGRDVDSAPHNRVRGHLSDQQRRERARNAPGREHRVVVRRDARTHLFDHASYQSRQLASGEMCAMAHVLEIAQEEVRRILAEGVIEPSASEWCSAPVIVKKANGGHRFCVDIRELNSHAPGRVPDAECR